MIIAKGDNSLDDKTIGNKAANLLWLEKNNFPTPSFEIINLRDLIDGYDQIIKTLVGAFSENNQQKIDGIFDGISWQDEKINNNYANLKQFNNTHVSFRTSAALEDLPDYSFAGLYETYLDIPFNKENLQKYLLACFRSIFAERVASYIHTNSIVIENIGFSVIIQKMFIAKFSGVAFVKYPISNTILVFNEGRGKEIVDGSNAFEIKLKNNRSFDMPIIIKNSESANSFAKLIPCIEKISYLKNIMQDIEWSVSDDALSILQTRNVTKKLKNDIQEDIFDCTNISESYPGVISPLTYSFIQFAYSKVYANFFKLVGVNESKIVKQRPIFENLLGYVNGKVYYRIFNWYKMIEILPGYNYNKEFFESMLIPQKKLATKKSGVKKNKLIIFIKNLPVILKFGYKLLFPKKLNLAFMEKFETKYSRHKNINLSSLTASGLCDYYTKHTEIFLDDWKIPVLNDFRLMIFHGILKKIIFANVKENPQLYLNDIISNFSDTSDLQIINEMKELSSIVAKDSILLELFQKSDSRMIYAELLNNDNVRILSLKQAIDSYIENFGDRRPNELILESPRMTESPEMLINLIKSYLKVNAINNHPKETRNLIKELENSIKQKKGLILGFVYSLFINFVADYTRDAIKYRELFRIKRAMVYGVARDCFITLAEKYVSANIIENSNDIFYLTINEILSIANTNSPESNYKKIISDRKEVWHNYENSPDLPQRLKIIGIGSDAQIINDMDKLNIKSEYSGIPTSCGLIRGRVVVLKKFDASIDIKDKIVITYQTDPGWSLIFPLIKGIILEKGNSLSHAAILSRELGIPSIVRVEGIVDKLKNGDLIEIDGNNGTIKLIQE